MPQIELFAGDSAASWRIGKSGYLSPDTWAGRQGFSEIIEHILAAGTGQRRDHEGAPNGTPFAAADSQQRLVLTRSTLLRINTIGWRTSFNRSRMARYRP